MMHRQEAQMGHYIQQALHQHQTHSVKRMQNAASHAKMPASSSRILLDVPCKVCRDNSSGKHYGIYACDGCAGFFKRSIRRNRQYACKAKAEGGCMVDKTHRNQCRSCRLAKCIQAGMNRDAVQHERGPRNSTIRRQMAMYTYGKDEMMQSMVPPSNAALNLVLPKTTPEPRVTVSQPTHHPVYTALDIPKMVSMIYPPPTSPLTLNFPLTVIETQQAEQAARILFTNVKWVRDLISDIGLCMDDQLVLLEFSWPELFVLSTAQCAPHMDPSHLYLHGTQGYKHAIQDANTFTETVNALRSFNLTPDEFEHAKMIVLFKAGLDCESMSSSRSSSGSVSPGGGSRLRDTALVLKLRDNALTALSIKMQATTPAGAMRFNQLTLVLLPMLRRVPAITIETFYFRKTIGFTAIEKIIGDVYLNQTQSETQTA